MLRVPVPTPPLPQYVKEKCNICLKTIACNHKSILCNLCNKKVHIKCNHFNKNDYKMLEKKPLQNFFCLSCVKDKCAFFKFE